MKLQDFRYFTGPSVIQPARLNLVVPVFAFAVPVWAGASTILGAIQLSNSYYFSLKLPIAKFGTAFILAIHWEEDDVSYRFKFWDDNDGVLYYPIYAGEKIGLNARLEIWSINSADIPINLTAEILESSKLVFPEGCSVCCEQPSGTEYLAVVTPTSIPPYSYCNPFCEVLFV